MLIGQQQAVELIERAGEGRYRLPAVPGDGEPQLARCFVAEADLASVVPGNDGEDAVQTGVGEADEGVRSGELCIWSNSLEQLNRPAWRKEMIGSKGRAREEKNGDERGGDFLE